MWDIPEKPVSLCVSWINETEKERVEMEKKNENGKSPIRTVEICTRFPNKEINTFKTNQYITTNASLRTL